MKSRFALTAAVALASVGVSARASTVYYATDAFESAYSAAVTTGSYGQFSFGYATTLGGTVTPYDATTSADGGTTHFLTRNPVSSDLVPSVFHNTSASVDSTFFTVDLRPDQLAFHPGSLSEYSVITFTAPANGFYYATALFEGIDNGATTTTDVFSLVNGTLQSSGPVTGFRGAQTDLSGSFALTSGDKLSFWVSVGANNTYYSDSTGIVGNLSISDGVSAAPGIVPLPASALSGSVLLLGMLTVGGISRRRAAVTA